MFPPPPIYKKEEKNHPNQLHRFLQIPDAFSWLFANMGDNQNNISRFPFKTFVFIPFADSICDVIYSGKETS